MRWLKKYCYFFETLIRFVVLRNVLIYHWDIVFDCCLLVATRTKYVFKKLLLIFLFVLNWYKRFESWVSPNLISCCLPALWKLLHSVLFNGLLQKRDKIFVVSWTLEGPKEAWRPIGRDKNCFIFWEWI